MTPDELKTLQYFKHDKLSYSGKTLDWSGYDFQTMGWLNNLRQHLRAPIRVIRGGVEHGEGKETAVDAIAYTKFSAVFMALLRLPNLSWGLYEGGSFHIDMREYDVFPARWIAFRNTPDREADLYQWGVADAIHKKLGPWIYITWNHEHAYRLLTSLIKINGTIR